MNENTKTLTIILMSLKKLFNENEMKFISMTKGFKIPFSYLNYTLQMKIGTSQVSWGRIAEIAY